jgi:mono/diheme cytochrome c family protein
MSSFEEDRLENEKSEPIESSSMKFVNVPLLLLATFFGFGVTYLALRTDRITMQEGDSRTHVAATTPEAAPGGGDAAAAAGGGAQVMDTAALMERGKQIYTTTCQACHQATGQGLPGTFPPLEGSEWVMGPPRRLAAIVLHGITGEITVKGEKFHGAMPTFKDQFKSEEIAAVATYVRRTFGKKDDTIDPALVEQVKEETKAQAGAWAGEAELNGHKWE